MTFKTDRLKGEGSGNLAWTEPDSGPAAGIVALLLPESERSPLVAQAAKDAAARPQLEAIQCTTPEHEKFLGDVRAHLKQRVKDLEAQRTKITDPLNAAKRAVDALFRPIRKPYEDLVELVDAKLSAYMTAQRDAQRALERSTAGTAQLSLPAPPESASETHGYVESWEVSKFDIDTLAASPEGRRFLSVDWSAVKILLRDWKDSKVAPEVPGLEFKLVSKPRARS